MKKIVVSIGLAAVGTAGLQAATYAPDMDAMAATKPWAISASLRGFYDDNINTSPSGPSKEDSFGFSVNPTLSINLPTEQTYFGLRYSYGLYYYQKREEDGQNPIDQTHEADLWLDHTFTERWHGKVQDSFVVAQEPELLQGGTPYRTEGNNIHNNGIVTLDTEWTPLFSTELQYQNNFYHYQNSGATVTPAVVLFSPASVDASLAGLLDRIEQLASLDLQWHIQPETIVFIGYQYGQVNYTGNEPIAAFSPFPYTSSFIYTSSSRDNRSHYGYVGITHDFLENLHASARGGVQYVDDYNDPLVHTTSLSPYADLNVIYNYTQGSFAQLGFTQSRNATDIAAVDSSGHITQDQESSTVHASVTHQITSKLTGNAIGTWQYSTYQYGQYNNQSDTFYTLGATLSYAFNPHLSADLSYDLDYLHSQIAGRGYTRNRVYAGISAAY